MWSHERWLINTDVLEEPVSTSYTEDESSILFPIASAIHKSTRRRTQDAALFMFAAGRSKCFVMVKVTL
jgi:replication-associated recombination protein RarA